MSWQGTQDPAWRMHTFTYPLESRVQLFISSLMCPIQNQT